MTTFWIVAAIVAALALGVIGGAWLVWAGLCQIFHDCLSLGKPTKRSFRLPPWT